MKSVRPAFSGKFRIGEFLIEKLIMTVSLSAFVVIILIFIFVFREALPVFFDSSPASQTQTADDDIEEQETYGEELSEEPGIESEGLDSRVEEGNPENGASSTVTGRVWQPVSENPKFGLLPLILGSLKVTMVSVLFGAPIAILAALFTSVFAHKRLKEFLKPMIELLAGFPSVIIGFFALVTMATYFQDIFGFEYRLNAFVGGIALSLAVIPIIYTVTEDALTAVPKVFMEASLAVGATKWQTALFVILPAATPGIFAAMLLGVGRAFGETMIVLMATGNAAIMSASIFEPVRTMSATIGAEMAEVVFGDLHYSMLFLVGSILFCFTFVLNAIAEWYVRARLLKQFRGIS